MSVEGSNGINNWKKISTSAVVVDWIVVSSASVIRWGVGPGVEAVLKSGLWYFLAIGTMGTSITVG